MDLYAYMNEVRPELDNAFRRCVSELLGSIRLSEPALLELGLNGGKKLRGALALLICEAAGGKRAAALRSAVLIELIQAASLIHDDFVDQDRERRRLPAGWILEGARRAVLIGDVLFAAAIQMAAELGREAGWVASRAIAEVSRGALLESAGTKHLPAEDFFRRTAAGIYDRVIHLKTGILFGAACELGALAAGNDRALRDGCLRFGLRIGEAYQIADDIQEIRSYLGLQTIGCERMQLLVPVLDRFSDKLPSQIRFSGKQEIRNDGRLRRCLETVIDRMKIEMEGRLESAATEIEALFPDLLLGRVAKRAPWELIDLF